MVSGFFYLNTMARKGMWGWVRHLLWLYVFWSVICVPLWVFQPDMVQDAQWYIFMGFFHLWYVMALIQAGLLLFLVKTWATSRLLMLAVALYGCAVWLSYTSGFGDSLIPLRLDLAAYLYRNGLFFGLPFMILGLIFARHRARMDALSPVHVTVLALVACVAIWAEAQLQIDLFDLLIYRDCTLSAFYATPVFFIVFSRLSGQKTGAQMGQFASALYFGHELILIPVAGLAAKFGTSSHWTAIFVVTLCLSCGLSVFLMWLNRRWRRIL